ncbi:MAG: polysaccharide biosynthesis/export family protein [Fimbriimonadaceae bacterium]|nr:polysaccharide biosynthesis/export family protein [Chitinophagales bacterium]
MHIFYSAPAKIFFCSIIICCCISCNFFFPNKLFKTPKDYEYAQLTQQSADYKLVPGDKFELHVFSNKGDKLLDPLLVSVSNMSSSGGIPVSLQYEIDRAGNVNLPVLGIVNLSGITEQEAMLQLQQLYAEHYIEPYVRLYVMNKRVTVYRGNERAEVVKLENKNMTIIEAIAQAGGITATGKSSKIKVIRENADSLQMSLIDLSTLEGLQLANTRIQPNDIIYIEPTVNTELIKELTPILTAVSGIIVIYVYFASLNKI